MEMRTPVKHYLVFKYDAYLLLLNQYTGLFQNSILAHDAFKRKAFFDIHDFCRYCSAFGFY